ncbi:MAG TPA: zinc ribbon domain-containing protein [Alkalispirochaeta sp.]|nr:zinc ribbon domain-containing protein [Alkalispirochaeta sp.]
MRRFYCEFCGAEVNEDDEVCSHCGAIFVAIKCPRCGYRDKQHRFHNGCPHCGFLSEHPGSTDEWAPIYSKRADPTYRRPMPSWVFWVVLIVLGGSFVILAQIYARL